MNRRASTVTPPSGWGPPPRLAGYTPPGSSLVPYGWDEVPNRTSAGGASTTFDAADRPTSTGFAHDLDGRLTAIPARGGAPAKALAYDALGRLTSATANGVTRTYAYDPLDRLATISEGGTLVTRLRYVGQTASVAQLLDGNDTVTRSIAVDAAGSALADWAPGGTGWRRYLTNGHGDLVAVAAADGTISASLRLDPWGVPLRAVPAGYPAFGFQGSLTDRTSTLVYARARWYDPVLATFTSEDPYPGELADPSSRHRYAYGAGDPVDRMDPEGLFWYKWCAGDEIERVALVWLGAQSRWRAIYNMNLNRSQTGEYRAGTCIWVPRGLWAPDARNQCTPGSTVRTGVPDASTRTAARIVLGSVRDWYLISPARIAAATDRVVGRKRHPGTVDSFVYNYNRAFGAAAARAGSAFFVAMTRRDGPGGMVFTCCHPVIPPPGNRATTYGEYVFVRDLRYARADTAERRALAAHEYIHVLQWEVQGLALAARYLPSLLPIGSTGPEKRHRGSRLSLGGLRAGIRRLPIDETAALEHLEAPLMGARLRRLALGLSVAVVIGACVPDDPRGYAVWVTNESANDYLVSMGGESSLGDTPDLASVTFLSPRRSVELMGPFVDLVRAADGSLLPAQVRVLSADCRVVTEFEVGAGDYHLVIDASGSSRLERYGWVQRPTSQDYLDETQLCVGR